VNETPSPETPPVEPPRESGRFQREFGRARDFIAARVWPALRSRFDRIAPRHIWIAALLALVVAGIAWNRCGVRGCPRIERLTSYQPNGATVLLDRNGKEFADLAPIRYPVVSLDSLPAHVAQAFLAVEDKRFYEHNGIDYRRVVGAALANLKSGGLRQGSSTISMQLARNVFPKAVPGQEKTFRRKLLEARVARMIEKRFEKDEILELYLNHIYFGNGAYGIEAAAQQYFRVPAKKLTLSQAALLAALPKAPAHYDPRRKPERAKERRNLVLALMSQQHRISVEESETASKGALKVAARPRRGSVDDGLGPYFEDIVRRQLEERFGDDVYEHRLKVYTTLDIRAQRAAEEELSKQLRTLEAGGFGKLNGPKYTTAAASGENGTGYIQGAMVLLDPYTGDVLALVGGRDFLDSPFNRATQSRRQIGSAFKPFVFAAAIEHGVMPSERLIDEPLRVEVSRTVSWEPKNYDGQFHGRVSMRNALVQSRNVPTVRLASSVGLGAVKETAVRAGITGDMPEHPSMPLGTVASSPLELARAYSVFPTLGSTPEARFVLRVEDSEGNELWRTDPKIESGNLDPRVAYIVTDMMRDAVERGTGTNVRRAGFTRTVAGKTGTTNDGTDAWFVGFTPDLVGAVWVGFDRRRSIISNASGGRLAAPVFGRVMRRLATVRPDPGSFRRPEGIVERTVDPESGLVLQDGCYPTWGQGERELFIEGREPGTVCPYWGGGWMAMRDFGRYLDEFASVLEALVGRSANQLEPHARQVLERYIRRAFQEYGGLTEHHTEEIQRYVEQYLRYQQQVDRGRRGARERN